MKNNWSFLLLVLFVFSGVQPYNLGETGYYAGLVVDGGSHFNNAAVFDAKISVASNFTTCTLNGASPATCTATITSGAKCIATTEGNTAASATAGNALSYAGTTLTVTAGNTHTEVVDIFCNK